MMEQFRLMVPREECAMPFDFRVATLVGRIRLISILLIIELVAAAGFKKIDMKIDDYGIFTVSTAIKE